jgi:hypothetical protein
MDPNAALTKLREAHAALAKWNDGEEWHVDSETIAALASDITDATESFEALDQWLSKDGFLPEGWGPVWAHRVLSAVNDWSDDEFVVAFGFSRDAVDGLCATCSVPDHDVCWTTQPDPDCRCCQQTVQAEPYASDQPVEGGYR